MLCKIYRTTFELNNSKKLRRVIASLSDGPYRYDNYYYCKPNVLEPIMKPYNFHFNEWELIIWNFNPELHEHWKYLVGILLLWIVLMPFWKAFINGPMASNGKEIVRIIYPLIPFYVTYLISAVIDG